jgi:hypothetical protein
MYDVYVQYVYIVEDKVPMYSFLAGAKKINSFHKNNPTIASYNAAGSLAHFVNKNIFFYF